MKLKSPLMSGTDKICQRIIARILVPGFLLQNGTRENTETDTWHLHPDVHEQIPRSFLILYTGPESYPQQAGRIPVRQEAVPSPDRKPRLLSVHRIESPMPQAARLYPRLWEQPAACCGPLITIRAQATSRLHILFHSCLLFSFVFFALIKPLLILLFQKYT